MADPAAHEKKNDGLGLRGIVRADDSSLISPASAHSPPSARPKKTTADLIDKIAPREASAGIDF